MSLLLDNTSLVTGICIIIPPENSLLVACRVVRHDKQILISLSVDIANSGICFNLLLPGVPLVTMVRFRLCMCMCFFFSCSISQETAIPRIASRGVYQHHQRLFLLVLLSRSCYIHSLQFSSWCFGYAGTRGDVPFILESNLWRGSSPSSVFPLWQTGSGIMHSFLNFTFWW